MYIYIIYSYLTDFCLCFSTFIRFLNLFIYYNIFYLFLSFHRTRLSSYHCCNKKSNNSILDDIHLNKFGIPGAFSKNKYEKLNIKKPSTLTSNEALDEIFHSESSLFKNSYSNSPRAILIIEIKGKYSPREMYVKILKIAKQAC